MRAHYVSPRFTLFSAQPDVIENHSEKLARDYNLDIDRR